MMMQSEGVPFTAKRFSPAWRRRSGSLSERETPSDCIIMGIRHILKDHGPDLVLSGVNRGQNVAFTPRIVASMAPAMVPE
jgi:5'-nucleotidase